jgi:dTDP-4-amino-4,6-dideoxygalactose transaminase/RimJ/RimL family protein N-acetyltransferase
LQASTIHTVPRLETPRLLLRPWSDDDVEEYARIVGDAEVIRHLGDGWRYEVKRTAAYLLARISDIAARREVSRLIEHWRVCGFGEWAVEEKATGSLIGKVGLVNHPDWVADPAKVEVGWLLARQAWGRGYATEAGRASLAYAFEGLEMERLISISYPRNRRSQRVMERLGLSPGGKTRWRGGEVIWYAIDQAEWTLVERPPSGEASNRDKPRSGGAAAKPARKDFLVFGSPAIEEAEIAEVVATLRSGWIGTGPRVARFEEMFRELIGARHAVALSSCTAALHLSMLASGIRPGDQVITTPMTFCATGNAIVHAGARPVFVDVDPRSGNIDPGQIEAAITPKTRAIVPVHYGGRPCQMDRIEAISRRNDLLLIEDAAHAIGAGWKGRKVGTIGNAGCFSFYVTKNVVTGEGGMVTTESSDLANKIKTYGLHGLSDDAWRRFSVESFRHYQVELPGYKYNMTDLQAALGIHQLPRVGTQQKRRGEIWSRYDEALESLPVVRPAAVDPDAVHARHLYSILVRTEEVGKTRDQILDELIRHRIGTGVHYLPLHLHPYYRSAFGYREGDFPAAEYIGARTLSLPLSAKLTDDDVDDVIGALRQVLPAA